MRPGRGRSRRRPARRRRRRRRRRARAPRRSSPPPPCRSRGRRRTCRPACSWRGRTMRRTGSGGPAGAPAGSRCCRRHRRRRLGPAPTATPSSTLALLGTQRSARVIGECSAQPFSAKGVEAGTDETSSLSKQPHVTKRREGINSEPGRMDRVSTPPQSMVASRTRTPAGVGRGRFSCGQGRVDADRGRGLFAHAEGACGFEVEVGRACIEKFTCAHFCRWSYIFLGKINGIFGCITKRA